MLFNILKTMYYGIKMWLEIAIVITIAVTITYILVILPKWIIISIIFIGITYLFGLFYQKINKKEN